jgi:sec-independent protein translocase protein TatB
MFFNVGGYEVLVIAVVALIVIGPEQLPTVLRKVGRYAAQVRSMATGLREEFMSGLGDVSDLTDLDSWLGSGTDDDPVVPRGFAERQKAQGTAAAIEATSDPAPNDSVADDQDVGDPASADPMLDDPVIEEPSAAERQAPTDGATEPAEPAEAPEEPS